MDWQSVSTVHDGRHEVASMHFTLPGQAPAVPGVQPPAPLHLPAGVSMPAEHAAVPHDMVAVG